MSAQKTLFDLGQCAGIYRLHLHDRVVYVGKARNIAIRIAAHARSKKIAFDTVSWIAVAFRDLDRAELDEIKRLQPIHNVHRKSPSLDDQPRNGLVLMVADKRAILWPHDLCKRWGISAVTRWRWEVARKIPPRDAAAGDRRGWFIGTIEAHEASAE